MSPPQIFVALLVDWERWWCRLQALQALTGSPQEWLCSVGLCVFVVNNIIQMCSTVFLSVKVDIGTPPPPPVHLKDPIPRFHRGRMSPDYQHFVPLRPLEANEREKAPMDFLCHEARSKGHPVRHLRWLESRFWNLYLPPPPPLPPLPLPFSASFPPLLPCQKEWGCNWARGHRWGLFIVPTERCEVSWDF